MSSSLVETANEEINKGHDLYYIMSVRTAHTNLTEV